MKARILLMVGLGCGLLSGVVAEPMDSYLSKPRGFVCPPCYHVDNLFQTEIYDHDGQCPICGMSLIEEPRSFNADKLEIHTGSGNFIFQHGLSHPDKPIIVFYHKPAGFGPDSPILLVVPGAGRNAWDYRDAWIQASEDHGVLVLAPSFDEHQYDFASYHLGGIVSNLELRNVEREDEGAAPSVYRLKDEDLVFTVNNNRDEWIFGDFDSIFRRVVAVTGSRQQTYDIFGHSAGGQILHRLAIFKPDSLAGRIVAANSGFYTIPSHEVALPFGVGGTEISSNDLVKAFSENLVLLLGEADNQSETRGTMLHTPTVDRRGRGRLSRGKYFYRESRRQAESLGATFNWRIEVVRDVGHDYRLMGQAAAEYLYAAGDRHSPGLPDSER